MKNVSWTLREDMAVVEKMQNIMAKDQKITNFTNMRDHLKSGGNGQWVFGTPDSGGAAKDVNLYLVNTHYKRLFGEKMMDQLMDDDIKQENLSNIYVGGVPYPKMCGFDIKKVHISVIMMDIMSYVNESAFQKTNKLGKLEKPLVMFKNGDQLEAVDLLERKKEPFTPFKRTWYSLVNKISFGSLYKNEVGVMEDYAAQKISHNAKKKQFEEDKKFVKNQEELEYRSTENIKKKETRELVNLLGEKEAAPKRQPSPEKKKTEITMTK